MKSVLLFILIFSFSISCHSQNLKVRIYNKTGFDIDSVVLSDKYIGKIKKGDSALLTDCSPFEIQDGAPFGLADGIIKGKVHDVSPLGFCGTGVENAVKGDYAFDITYRETPYGYRLFWQKHN